MDILIRLGEQKRIYQDSPNCNATYADLARLIEDLIGMIEEKQINGFGKDK